MELPDSTCSVCSRRFVVRFRYQVREEAGRFEHFCSLRCQQASLSDRDDRCECSVCGTRFRLEFPFQVSVVDHGKRYFCSMRCYRKPGAREHARPASRRIAVFNHKGGTGKTTTAINVAAAFAERGDRVLLIDADGQGNVGASLGIRGERTLYHVLVAGAPVEDAVIPVRPNLDVLTSNELLAAAELYLAGRPNRDRVMRERLGSACAAYDTVIIDCAPALSLMNQNVLVLADSVVVPVACEYLSLVGVRQVLKTLKNVRELLGHPVQLMGVVPTFYDVRNRICREALDALQSHFGEQTLPAIRVNTRLKEAPSKRQTVFENAPDSHGAEDYLRLAEMLKRAQSQRAATSPPRPAAAAAAAAPALR